MGLSQAGLAEVDLNNCAAWGEEEAMDVDYESKFTVGLEVGY